MFAILAAAAAAAVTSTAATAPAADRLGADVHVVMRISPAVRGRACGLWDADPVRRSAPMAGPQSLGDLPPANLELTVLRLDEDGCSVPVIVRRNISGDGRFATPGR